MGARKQAKNAARQRAAGERAAARRIRLARMEPDERARYLRNEKITAGIIAAVLGAAVLAFVVHAYVDYANHPPIIRQSCAQLATTEAGIERALIEPTDAERTKAEDDATVLAARVDDLGGCPDEPSLR